MTGRAEVVVVGGGPVGACVAAALAGAGADLMLLERESQICPPLSAAYGNSGLITPSESIPLAAPGAVSQGLRWMRQPVGVFNVAPRLSRSLSRWLWLFRAACDEARCREGTRVLYGLHELSAALHEDLAREHAGQWLHRHCGLFQLYESEPGLEAAGADVERLRQLGLRVEEIPCAAVARDRSGIRCDVAGGFFFPDDAQVEPWLFTQAMAARAAGAGARVRTGVEALAVVEERAGVRIVTTKGDVFADQAVLAAGAWTRELARAGRLRLPLEPAKGYSIDIPWQASPRPDGESAFSVGPAPAAPVLLMEESTVLTPYSDVVRVGSVLELAGWDMKVDPRQVSRLRDIAGRVMGSAAGAPLRQVWRGMRPASPDGLPFIGRLPGCARVLVATGHGMLGLSLGPVTGRLVAELAGGQAPSLDLRPLSPARFG